MSKVGKKPISVPKEVDVDITKGLVSIKGPKGKLTLGIRPEVAVSLEKKEEEKLVKVMRKNDSKLAKSLHGVTRTLIANMIVGVTEGFSKQLKIVGTGYRAKIEAGKLSLSVGFSHPVDFKPPSGIDFALTKKDIISISGVDKQLVGQVAAQIRNVRPPDVYKGKGIRYKNEVIRKKPGKAVKVGAA